MLIPIDLSCSQHWSEKLLFVVVRKQWRDAEQVTMLRMRNSVLRAKKHIILSAPIKVGNPHGIGGRNNIRDGGWGRVYEILSSGHGMPIAITNAHQLWLREQDLYNIKATKMLALIGQMNYRPKPILFGSR